MYTLISFATQWGSKYGGINSFNTDFLSAFGFAYHHSAQVICIVASSTPEEIKNARKVHVRLVPLPYQPEDKLFIPEQARVAIDELKRWNISFNPDKTIWLGHDRITGAASNEAARIAGGRTALIHHMSYDHYESYAEDSGTANKKIQEQISLFQKADLLLAVGPLLRDALNDRLGESKPVHMLIPGLAEIDTRNAPKTFTAFLSGRLSDDAARIKQGYLGIAAFAQAHKEARDSGMPDGLYKQPKLMLRGVDFEAQTSQFPSPPWQDLEAELKKFAEGYAQSVINLYTLPYTQDRQRLYSDLSAASVAMMPSWHEGFGLVAWEAIAAGVPLIISKSSGVYSFLEENYPGAGPGCVYAVDVRGSNSLPFFHQEDLAAVAAALKAVAINPGEARRKAAILRDMLGDYTWAACAEQAVEAFEWPLQKGSVSATTIGHMAQAPSCTSPITMPPVSTPASPLRMPVKQWKAGAGMADSQLLRAEEALVSFDLARQPELDRLNTWLDDTQWPQAVRLITGTGGLGKTRLALELCLQRMASDWHAGFLDSDLNEKDMIASWQTLKSINQPLLIIIDYAETRQTVLLALIKALLQNLGNRPVRLLLLARDGGEWWDNLPSKDQSCESLLNGYATSGPYRLPALYAAEHDRRKAYKQALYAFAQALGVTAPDIVPDLKGEHFETPLYVQMAALMALYGERPNTAEGLTKALLNRERRYWRGLLAYFKWTEPERYAQQLLALTTLAGGFTTPRDVQPYWDLLTGNALNPAEFSSLFHSLAQLYPGKQGLQAVQPDLLGEALVAQALLHNEADTLLDAVLGNKASQLIHCSALTVIARLSSQRLDLHETLVEALVRHFAHCCHDIVAVSTESTSRLPKVAEEAFTRLPPGPKSQVAGLLEPIVLEESVQLAELNCLVAEYLVEKSRNKYRKKTNVDRMADYAKALGNHSINLSRTGRNQQAFSSALKVLELFNQLNRKDPKRFVSNYAMSLNNYATYLSDAGQNEEALKHSQQAMEIRQRLAQKNPDRYEPDYAMSLNNYATHLSKVGQNKEALAHSQQALEICQRLAQKNPDRYEPDYATSLNNYATHLSEAGQNEGALEHSQQAMEIYQQLAQKRPVRFAEDLSSSTCLTHFLSWLCNQTDKSSDLADLRHIATMIPAHRRSLMFLFSSFVQACWATDQAARIEAFKQVLSYWGDLSPTAKNEAQGYWLCTAAWCATFAPAAFFGQDWQANWHQYANQRQGRIPHWMQELARRLSFQWPV